MCAVYYPEEHLNGKGDMARGKSEQQDIFATADSASRSPHGSGNQGSGSGSGQVESSPKVSTSGLPAGKDALAAIRKGDNSNGLRPDLTNDFSAISVGSIGAPLCIHTVVLCCLSYDWRCTPKTVQHGVLPHIVNLFCVVASVRVHIQSHNTL